MGTQPGEKQQNPFVTKRVPACPLVWLLFPASLCYLFLKENTEDVVSSTPEPGWEGSPLQRTDVYFLPGPCQISKSLTTLTSCHPPTGLDQCSAATGDNPQAPEGFLLHFGPKETMSPRLRHGSLMNPLRFSHESTPSPPRTTLGHSPAPVLGGLCKHVFLSQAGKWDTALKGG